MTPDPRKTSPLTIAAAWVLVTIPLAWGVYQSVVHSLPLFRASASEGPGGRAR